MILEDYKTSIDEMAVDVEDGLPSQITNSIYYSKLKHLLFAEIVSFCREKYDLKEDLQNFRIHVGEKIPEYEIRDYLDKLKSKYNNKADTNIGLDYHIEFTRVDMSVCIFVCIKRDEVSMKKFVFRFRKAASDSMAGLTTNNTNDPDYEITNNDRLDFYTNMIANLKKDK